MSTGTRGKWAEDKVKALLKGWAGSSRLNYWRLPDARAGSFQPTTSDFLVGVGGLFTFLEVKEVDHMYRLPKPNFKMDQRGRIRAWELAGAQSLVLVAFTPLKTRGPECKMWRSCRLSYFTGDDTGSWGMASQPLSTLDTALAPLLLKDPLCTSS